MIKMNNSCTSRAYMSLLISPVSPEMLLFSCPGDDLVFVVLQINNKVSSSQVLQLLMGLFSAEVVTALCRITGTERF